MITFNDYYTWIYPIYAYVDETSNCKWMYLQIRIR
jgi:hypothetical protein